jgi:hypothetical protein
MDRRALIAIALSFVVLFGSNLLFQKLGWIPSPAQQRARNEAKSDSTSRPSAAPARPRSRAQSRAGSARAGDAEPGAPERHVGRASGRRQRADDRASALHRAHPGAGRAAAVGRAQELQGRQLRRATLAADPLVALDLGDEQTPASLADVPFAWSDSLDASGRIAKLAFTARDSSGLVIEETYRFLPDDYRIGYSVAITGVDPKLDMRRYRIALRSWPLSTERNRLEDLNNLAVTAKIGKDNKREMAGGLKNGAEAARRRDRLAGGAQQVLPARPRRAERRGRRHDGGAHAGHDPEAHDFVAGDLDRAAAGPGRVHEYMLYAGPLDYWHVQRIGMDLEPPHALAFNFFKPFSSALAWLLAFFHRWWGTGGWRSSCCRRWPRR